LNSLLLTLPHFIILFISSCRSSRSSCRWWVGCSRKRRRMRMRSGMRVWGHALPYLLWPWVWVPSAPPIYSSSCRWMLNGVIEFTDDATGHRSAEPPSTPGWPRCRFSGHWLRTGSTEGRLFTEMSSHPRPCLRLSESVIAERRPNGRRSALSSALPAAAAADLLNGFIRTTWFAEVLRRSSNS